jgi:transposase
MAIRKRRRFPESSKRQAVERVLDSGLLIVLCAEKLGLHETPLRRWMKRFSEPSQARRPDLSAHR